MGWRSDAARARWTWGGRRGHADSSPGAPADSSSPVPARLGVWLAIGFFVVLGCALPAQAFRVIGSGDRWVRWDAAPRFVNGEERSLAGGLRYSIETGSYAGLRDQFLWIGTAPSEQAFGDAVRRAFEHWEVVDPATGLPAGFHFVEDLETEAIDAPGNPSNPNAFLGANPGAEIDLFAETPHPGPGFGASVIFYIDTTENDLTLTSGTTDYPGFAITGADIRINPAFAWSLTAFETLLTHEIGHALGLADLESSVSTGQVSGFLDDDYDPTSSLSALATLTNVSALAIDPFDPDTSPLSSFAGPMNTDPGLDSPGAFLLMESEGWPDLAGAALLLQNDDFAGRQFLYPVPLPEPGMGLLLLVGTATLSGAARWRRGPR